MTLGDPNPPNHPGNERRSIANCYADRELSVITKYLNDNAHTPHNRFVVYMLYKHVCNKYGKHRTDGA